MPEKRLSIDRSTPEAFQDEYEEFLYDRLKVYLNKLEEREDYQEAAQVFEDLEKAVPSYVQDSQLREACKKACIQLSNRFTELLSIACSYMYFRGVTEGARMMCVILPYDPGTEPKQELVPVEEREEWSA